jgi:hypothetical protein
MKPQTTEITENTDCPTNCGMDYAEKTRIKAEYIKFVAVRFINRGLRNHRLHRLTQITETRIKQKKQRITRKPPDRRGVIPQVAVLSYFVAYMPEAVRLWRKCDRYPANCGTRLKPCPTNKMNKMYNTM